VKYNKDGRWRISGMADVMTTSLLPKAGGRDCAVKKKVMEQDERDEGEGWK
jgi:hypothetical protein